MSIEKVREYLAGFGKEQDVLEFTTSSATVELAAEALHTEPARIAKSLSLRGENGSCILVVTAGDTKIDNASYKATFGLKAKMLTPDEALAETGHAVGGVCPFALPEGVRVYLDTSLQRFETVYPACGSSNSAIPLSPEDLFRIARAAEWVSVCVQRT